MKWSRDQTIENNVLNGNHSVEFSVTVFLADYVTIPFSQKTQQNVLHKLVLEIKRLRIKFVDGDILNIILL